MAAWRFGNITGILTSLVYGYLLFGLSRGQCPEKSPVLPDKVAGSDVVVQGRVSRHFKVNAGDKGYTAELGVLCVFKGGPVPSVLNVTRAGEQEGACVVAKLLLNSRNLVYLKRSSGDENNPTFTPVFAEDPAETSYLDELRYSCGLNVQLPTGQTTDLTGYCDQEKFTADVYMDDCPEPSPVGGSATAMHRSTLWTLACAIGGVLLSCSMLRSLL